MILSDSECGVVVGARRVFLETADVLGSPPPNTTTFSVYTEYSKKEEEEMSN